MCWASTQDNSNTASRYRQSAGLVSASHGTEHHSFVPQRITGCVCGTQLCVELKERPCDKWEKPSQTSIIKMIQGFRLRKQEYLREPSCLWKVLDQTWKKHQERGGHSLPHSHPHSLSPVLWSCLSADWHSLLLCVPDGPRLSQSWDLYFLTWATSRVLLTFWLANSKLPRGRVSLAYWVGSCPREDRSLMWVGT